uniref:Uncharacterized protein n=1 Tax=Lotharella globosa TaxID=91324 RepID=A0A6V3QZ27_9EUKA|mmetsp:Transcript_30274/g.58323  ORF Transcript_30274/g.58323 Transcript_30274/m.58323 type:complete len:175 (+) Transcript_30274:556-1080(+)
MGELPEPAKQMKRTILARLLLFPVVALIGAAVVAIIINQLTADSNRYSHEIDEESSALSITNELTNWALMAMIGFGQCYAYLVMPVPASTRASMFRRQSMPIDMGNDFESKQIQMSSDEPPSRLPSQANANPKISSLTVRSKSPRNSSERGSRPSSCDPVVVSLPKSCRARGLT